MIHLIRHPMFPFVVIGLIFVLIIAGIEILDLYQRPPPPDFKSGDLVTVDINGWPARVTRLRYDGWLGTNTGWLVDCVLEIPNRPTRTYRADELREWMPGIQPACQSK